MKKLLGIALLVMSGHVVLAQADSTKSSYKNGSYYSHQNDTTKNKKDKSTMAKINNIEKTIKNLTASLNKLKTKFKTKGESSKKE